MGSRDSNPLSSREGKRVFLFLKGGDAKEAFTAVIAQVARLSAPAKLLGRRLRSPWKGKS